MALLWQNLVLVIVTTLGFIKLLISVINFYQWALVVCLRQPKDLKQYGSWALITGCTDGIGKAMALELASKGLNLVLVGQNPSKLEATSNEIQTSCYGTTAAAGKIETNSIVINLAEASHEEITRALEDGMEGLDVGVVINNAATAHSYAQYFHEVRTEVIDSILGVNIEAATWVIKAVLPGMMKRKKGIILNMGSSSTHVLPSYPLYTTYVSSKKYLSILSRSISLEYRQFGIDIQCQIPQMVATRMSPFKKSSLLIPSTETFTKESLRWVGYHEHTCMPYLPHYLLWCFMSLLPGHFWELYMFRHFSKMRERALAKKKLKSNAAASS